MGKKTNYYNEIQMQLIFKFVRVCIVKQSVISSKLWREED